MARTLAGVLAGLMVLVAAGAASAGIPDPDLSTVVLTAGGLTTCPAGHAADVVYQYITVTAKRSDATPIQGIPWSSFFFTVTGGDVTLTHVDAETDVNGQIRFTVLGNESIQYPNTVGIEVQIYTVVLNDSDNLPCVSVDLFPLGAPDGQCVGADFVEFGKDYNKVAPRSNFNWSVDGLCGGADFVIFGHHYNHHN